MRQFQIETIKFAWLPKRLTNGQWVWFKKYISVGVVVYPKWDLPSNIGVPNNPFYIELERWSLDQGKNK